MDNIDFDTSALVFAEKQIGELGEELYTEMLKVLNGKLTKQEVLGITEMAIGRQCNYT